MNSSDCVYETKEAKFATSSLSAPPFSVTGTNCSVHTAKSVENYVGEAEDILNIPSVEYMCVEIPGVIKSDSVESKKRAYCTIVKSLGGEENLRKAYVNPRETPLVLRFCYDDICSKFIDATHKDSTNILVNVTKRKSGKVEYKILGRITQKFYFDCVADFHIAPPEEYRLTKDIESELDENVVSPFFIPPPHFSRMHTPFPYAYEISNFLQTKNFKAKSEKLNKTVLSLLQNNHSSSTAGYNTNSQTEHLCTVNNKVNHKDNAYCFHSDSVGNFEKNAESALQEAKKEQKEEEGEQQGIEDLCGAFLDAEEILLKKRKLYQNENVNLETKKIRKIAESVTQNNNDNANDKNNPNKNNNHHNLTSDNNNNNSNDNNDNDKINKNNNSNDNNDNDKINKNNNSNDNNDNDKINKNNNSNDNNDSNKNNNAFNTKLKKAKINEEENECEIISNYTFKTRKKAAEPIMNITAKFSDIITPNQPPPLALKASVETVLYSKLSELFSTRPLWLRHAVDAKLPKSFSAWKKKPAFARCCYLIVDGPWRWCLCRYGYNPKEDPAARKYQTIDFRGDHFRTIERRALKCNAAAKRETEEQNFKKEISKIERASPERHSKVSTSCASSSSFFPYSPFTLSQATSEHTSTFNISNSIQDKSKVGEMTKNNENQEESQIEKIFNVKSKYHSFLIPPVRPSQVYQLCEIEDKTLQNIIQNAPYSDTCSRESGWFKKETLENIRDMMIMKCKRMREQMSTKVETNLQDLNFKN